MDYTTGKILSVKYAGGRTHDFQLFKESSLQLPEAICILADKGYQGIKKIYPNSIHPIKKRKKEPLKDNQRLYNLLVSRLRFPIERVNGMLKRFKILSYRYRNKVQTFTSTFSLICGIYNFQFYF